MMFGMTMIANVLTTRTVQTYTTWLTPFGDFEVNDKTDKCKAAFNKLKERVIEVEANILAQNELDEKEGRFRYIHLLPSNVDISLSI